MKTLLRKAGARTIDETWRTIGTLLDWLYPDRMRKLLQKRRIRFSLTRSRFSATKRSVKRRSGNAEFPQRASSR